MNFWQKLRPKADEPMAQKKPILILAPMDDVTDSVFRQIVIGVGRPDVFFTEFTNVDALTSTGQKKVLGRLAFVPTEKPIVAQIWGSDPEKFYQVAQMISKMGFDGIDINMGCPDKKVIKANACSALIKNPKLANEIIQATIRGSNGLPVGVKTRIGFSSIQTEEWVSALLANEITALTLHFRTVKEMSKVPAHWEQAKIAVDIRNKMKSKTLIIGNGDVKSLQEANDKCKKYGIDGVMIGRGIFENVWLFNPDINPNNITVKDRLELLVKHIKLFEETKGLSKNFATLKKFVKCYINGFSGASEMRAKLMETKNLDELKLFSSELLVSYT